MFRRILFWLHLVTGLVAGAVILSMAISGLLIAFEVQLTEWANRDLRIAATSPPLSVESLLLRLRESRPDLQPTGITLKADPHAPVTVNMGRRGVYFADPASGRLLGQGHPEWREFFHAATDWHRFLTQTGLERPIGKALTGAGTLLFGVLLLSGLYLWWPRHLRLPNWRAVLLLNRRLKGRARDWNWHVVIGFWSSFPMLLIVLTGLIMSYSWANHLLFRLTGNEPPPARQKGGRESPPVPPVLDLKGIDPLLRQVQSQHPDWRSLSLLMPTSPEAPVPVMLDRGGRGQPHLRHMFSLHLQPQQWRVSADDFSQQNLGRRLRQFARFLHTGELFGVAGQGVAAFSCLAAILLVWTGFALAWRRFRRRSLP